MSWQAMPRGPDDVVGRLAAACHTGDAGAIGAVLDPEVVAVCDSGGRVPAPIRPVQGAAEVARLLRSLLPGTALVVESVNGSPGLVFRQAGRAVAVVAVTGDERRATALWIVLNPAKLRGW